jgi:hypothetical protein
MRRPRHRQTRLTSQRTHPKGNTVTEEYLCHAMTLPAAHPPRVGIPTLHSTVRTFRMCRWKAARSLVKCPDVYADADIGAQLGLQDGGPVETGFIYRRLDSAPASIWAL